jgi:hypothetical protein
MRSQGKFTHADPTESTFARLAEVLDQVARGETWPAQPPEKDDAQQEDL